MKRARARFGLLPKIILFLVAVLIPLAIIVVLLRGLNDDQAPELLRWSLDHGYELRFIEQMPLDAQHDWSRTERVTADEILTSLEREFTLTPASEPRGSAPAELWTVDGGPARPALVRGLVADDRPVRVAGAVLSAHRGRAGQLERGLRQRAARRELHRVRGALNACLALANALAS